jgi:hypothetical protein
MSGGFSLVANFLFIIGAIAILSQLISSKSNTSGVVNSLSNLLTNSIKAAKS